MSKPPAVAEITWTGDLRFSVSFTGQDPRSTIVLDGSSKTGPSPVNALVAALVGCMSADVVHTLTRGRHPLRALRAHLTAERAPDAPHRVTSVTIHFTVEGNVPGEAVGRAIDLSREKYCSVWHSMRQDIALVTTYDVKP